jgi:hypothetical protein
MFTGLILLMAFRWLFSAVDYFWLHLQRSCKREARGATAILGAPPPSPQPRFPPAPLAFNGISFGPESP